jgi:hypothetical protein
MRVEKRGLYSHYNVPSIKSGQRFVGVHVPGIIETLGIRLWSPWPDMLFNGDTATVSFSMIHIEYHPISRDARMYDEHGRPMGPPPAELLAFVVGHYLRVLFSEIFRRGNDEFLPDFQDGANLFGHRIRVCVGSPSRDINCIIQDVCSDGTLVDARVVMIRPDTGMPNVG